MTGDDLIVHLRAKNYRLERDVEFLAAERARLERLLAYTLNFAAASAKIPDRELVDRRVDGAVVLLEAIAAIYGERLERPAFVDDAQRDAQLSEELAWYEAIGLDTGGEEAARAA